MELSPLRFRALLALLFLLALGVRIWVAARYQGLASPPDAGAYPDQLEYDNLAQRLSQGLGYTGSDGRPTAFRPPGAPFTLLPVYLVAGRDYAALRVWICLLSAATVLALAWSSAPAFGRMTALVGAGILAVDPGHVYYAQHLVSEVPFCLFATLAFGAAWRAFAAGARGREARGWDALAGLLGALATLVRPQFLFVVALVAMGALVSRRRRVLLGRVALQTGVFALCLSTWLVRNALVMGAPTMSTLSGYLFWGVHNDVTVNGPFEGTWRRPDELMQGDWPPKQDEVEYDRRCWHEGLAWVRAHPGKLPELVHRKFDRMLSAVGGTDNALLRRSWARAWRILAPLLLIGLVAAWRRDRLATWILIAHLGSLVLVTLIFSGQIRYRHTLEPEIAILAGAGLVALIELARRAWVRGRAAWSRAGTSA